MAEVRRLPVPDATRRDWRGRGACRDMDDDLFFPPARERDFARAVRETRAKLVCRGCPVRPQCRDHALSVREPHGIWGGLSEAERDEHRRAEAARSVVTPVDFVARRASTR